MANLFFLLPEIQVQVGILELVRIGLTGFTFEAECLPESNSLPALLDDLEVGLRSFMLDEQVAMVLGLFQVGYAVCGE